MFVELTLSAADARDIVERLAPLRIWIGEHAQDRWVELFEPTAVQLLPGRGLAMTCRGRFRYDLGPIPVRFEIRSIQLVLEPRVVEQGDGRSALSFLVEIESADLAGVPAGIDDMLVEQVNRALTPRATHMIWNAQESLRGDFICPPQLEPIRSMHVATDSLALHIDTSAVKFRFDVGLRIERDAAPATRLAD